MRPSDLGVKEGENVMRILVTLQRRRIHRYLINLFTKALIKEVRELIKNKENAKALKVVFKEGLLVREVLEDELCGVDADLMLSDTYARWDLTE